MGPWRLETGEGWQLEGSKLRIMKCKLSVGKYLGKGIPTKTQRTECSGPKEEACSSSDNSTSQDLSVIGISLGRERSGSNDCSFLRCKVDDKKGDNNVLDGEKEGFAIGGEWECISGVVSKVDRVGHCLESLGSCHVNRRECN